MESKRIFFNCLKEEFAPKLRKIGFKGNGQHFRRILGEVIHTITIQGYRYGGKCCLNLGLHLTFLPIPWPVRLPDVKTVKVIDCEFRTRVTPYGESDYWWTYHGGEQFISPQASARHLIHTYFDVGEPRFHRYNSVEKISQSLTVEDLRAGNFHNLFGVPTIPRAALTMARIHQFKGDLELAKTFAMIGVEHLGAGVGLKFAFENILDS